MALVACAVMWSHLKNIYTANRINATSWKDVVMNFLQNWFVIKYVRFAWFTQKVNMSKSNWQCLFMTSTLRYIKLSPRVHIRLAEEGFTLDRHPLLQGLQPAWTSPKRMHFCSNLSSRNYDHCHCSINIFCDC